MAVTVEQVLGGYDDGDTVAAAVETGSNRLQLAIAIASDNASGASTLSTHSIGGVSFDGDSAILTAGSNVPWFKSVHSWNLDGGAEAGTYDWTIDTVYLNAGAAILELADVDQTTPILTSNLKKAQSVTTLAHDAFTIPDESLIIILQSITSSDVPIAPTSSVGSYTWTEQIADDAKIVGGSMAGGSLWTAPATAEAVSEVITATADANAASFASYMVVVGVAPAASGIIPIIMHHRRMMQ